MHARRHALALLCTLAAVVSCTSGSGNAAGRSTSTAAPSRTVSSTEGATLRTLPPPAAPSGTPATSTVAPSHTVPASTASTPLVVLNPGHNGGNASHPATINRQVYAGYGVYKACDTTGTETNAGYPEHAFTWNVARRVARILRAHGLRVTFTRTSDTGVGPCVDRRAAIGNHRAVAAVVSIHADGAPSAGHGFHVNIDSRRPEGATAAVYRASKRLSRVLHAALQRSSGLVPSTYIGRDGYYYRDELAGLNLARRPATFLELGNMRNAHDARLLTSARGRARIARAVAAGILAYLHR